MRKVIKGIISDKFFTATFWVFLGTGFLNVGSYVFHLSMARMLGVSLYGALESLISLLYILSVPTTTLMFVIVKFVSSYKGRGDEDSISAFYTYLSKKLLIYGSILLIIFLLTSGLIKSFLHLPTLFLAILLPICFYINLLYFLNKSFIQGVSDFFRLSILSLVESLTKVILGILLVYLGYKVEGSFGAIVISVLAGFVLSCIYLRRVVTTTNKKFTENKYLLKFTLPTFATTFALISIFTTDIILVRHFFPGVESGYYSALSVLGKIIYFAASPVILVLFPMVSENHARGEKYSRLLALGLGITLLISLGITSIYVVIPRIMLLAFFGEKYLPITSLLGLFGIFISLHTVNSLIANFFLSIHRISATYLVVAAAGLQLIAIFVFHTSITQVIYVNIIISFLLLISLLLYYANENKGK